MRTLLVIFLLLFATLGCVQRHEGEVARDLSAVCDSGELVALTLPGAASYFVYKGKPMGFHFARAQQLADSLGVALRIELAESEEQLVEKLLAGEGDLIAYDLPMTEQWRSRVLFCGERCAHFQVLVQRADRDAVDSVAQLVEKKVYAKGGRNLQRLQALNREIGGGIIIKEDTLPYVSTEDLIVRVAKGKIDYAVCDYDIAQLCATHFCNLDISLALSYVHEAGWAVRPDAQQLAAAIDAWQASAWPELDGMMRTYAMLSNQKKGKIFLAPAMGVISPFDNLFKQYAPEINWDWRMLAALAYIESSFDTTAVSAVNAVGLMQMMPATARLMGVPAGMEQNPEESIKAATKYLGKLDHSFGNVADDHERFLFVLAAYNAGIGHIRDAQALATKYGDDPCKWSDNVERYILMMSDERYYTDSLCHFGYFRGLETTQFIKDVVNLYEIYEAEVNLAP